MLKATITIIEQPRSPEGVKEHNILLDFTGDNPTENEKRLAMCIEESLQQMVAIFKELQQKVDKQEKKPWWQLIQWRKLWDENR